MIDVEWTETPKETDPNFEGSIWQKMGHDPELCPTCGAHLYDGICLNACHLTRESRERFAQGMIALKGRGGRPAQ
jgi:hypothetical protein